MKGKRKMIGWMITLSIVGVLAVSGGIGWSKLTKEHEEARALPLNTVDFNELTDGTYQGYYEGGMYKWRENECEVIVSDGKVSEIKMLSSKDPGAENTTAKTLYERVVAEQSLQVDAISGATLTSKAYLQAVENALLQTQNN
ncbi:MAG: FMN-binding protein [Anaerolineaceae bacterium]|nr:FMN-binding protein [Anaerolineaceae bacterium]